MSAATVIDRRSRPAFRDRRSERFFTYPSDAVRSPGRRAGDAPQPDDKEG